MNSPFSIRHHDTIGSTNDEARRLASEGAPHGTVIHAEEQTAGRGRLTRSWFSPPGNLYLSIVLRTGKPIARAAELSFVTALTVADTVEAILPRPARALLKWPNDVLINNAKIAGILLEHVGEATIVGVGLNVLQAPAHLAASTTTIVANGGGASVAGARDVLLARLARHYATWRDHGFPPIREAWLARSYPPGTTIMATVGGKAVGGAFAGVDATGALLLDTPEGPRRVVAGEIGFS